MISLSAAVTVFWQLLGAGLIFGLLWWLVGYMELPAPFDKVAGWSWRFSRSWSSSASSYP